MNLRSFKLPYAQFDTLPEIAEKNYKILFAFVFEIM